MTYAIVTFCLCLLNFAAGLAIGFWSNRLELLEAKELHRRVDELAQERERQHRLLFERLGLAPGRGGLGNPPSVY